MRLPDRINIKRKRKTVIDVGGGSFTDDDYDNKNGIDIFDGDYGEPDNADPDYSVTTLTNTVGQLQGINGTQRYVGCTPTDCDWNNDLKPSQALA